MSNIIEAEIETIVNEITEISDLRKEYLFSLVCYKYYYNSGRLDKKDYKGCFADGKDDGGIDIITTEENDDQTRFILIQGKMVSDISKQEVVDIFTKIHQTKIDFDTYTTGRLNDRLKRIYKEKLDSVIDKVPLFTFILFTTASPSLDTRIKIRQRLDEIDIKRLYDIQVIYKDEIEKQIENIKEPKRFVAEDKIKISKADGVLKNGDNGILVNIMARSLRDLYDRHKDAGLFEQNFRYFITNKRIDDNINLTLSKKRQMFWFMNNGIIIACKDFRPDVDNVKLYDFSIVNGCQTTTLIGQDKSPHQNEDFVLPCKIVKPLKDEDFDQFVADIAEASNSQKPISDRDLKSTKREQRILQKQLSESEPKVYLNIKRGEKLLSPAKKKQLIGEWQCLPNDLFGQFILSFHFQQPGTARSSKRSIFSSPATYDKIFVKRKFDKANIVDILKLDQYYYTYFLNAASFTDTFSDPDQQSVALNGRFIILAILGFILKVERGLINLKTIRSSEDWEKEISKDELTGPLFIDNLPDDFTTILNSMFTDFIMELALCYKNTEKQKKSVSNFFKLDTTYRDTILKYIVDQYRIPLKRKYLDTYLKLFSI